VSFIEYLKRLDTELFLLLNGMHNPFWDKIMYWASLRATWIPLYVLLLFLVIKTRKKIIPVILCSALLIVLTDKGSVLIFKENFKRYRPCHNLVIKDKVHVLPDCGGTYGFVSSHAANTFGLALFLSLLFLRDYRYFPLLIFSWCLLVSYSRIYCGQHYPGDILVGGMYGMLISLVVWKVFKFIIRKQEVKVFRW
jgi:undecaprenyl-diphosphatase